MKLLLILCLLLAFNVLSQNDTVYINFVEDTDEYVDCKTNFLSNGLYIIQNQDLYALDLPFTIPILPKNQIASNSIRILSNASRMASFGKYHSPSTYYEIIPQVEKDAIIFNSSTGVYRSQLNDLEVLEKHQFYLVPESHYELLDLNQEEEKEEEEEIVDPYSPLRKHAYTSSNVIIDGIFIDERYYYHLSKFFDVHPDLLDFYQKRQEKVNQHIQTEIAAIFQPFYFSQFEVTNGEYREFTNYVKDSIALEILYFSILDDDSAAVLLNTSKKEIKQLDLTDRIENLNNYGFKVPKAFYDNPDYLPYLSELYHPMPTRYYKRREINVDNIIYRLDSLTEIAIYPDTSNFIKITDSINSPLQNMYFWHPAYADYPVVNLNMEQMLAYCHWKEVQVNKKHGKDSIYIHVSPPTIGQYEFAVKQQQQEVYKNIAVDQKNNRFKTYKRDVEAYNYLEKVYEGNQKKIFIKIPLIDRILSHRKIKLINDTLIMNLNGNVSEVVIDKVFQEGLDYYGIESEDNLDSIQYVLGPNYQKNAVIIGDDTYNSIFFKTVKSKNTSNCTTGFRLVYTIEYLNH